MLSFGISYDIVQNSAREQCKVARIVLCLLLSILNRGTIILASIQYRSSGQPRFTL